MIEVAALSRQRLIPALSGAGAPPLKGREMIKPTVGRVIWFYQQGMAHDGQPLVGFITYVHSDKLINVAGFDATGVPYSSCLVTLYQDPEKSGVPVNGPWARWMPYQVGQAAKYEEVSAQRAAAFVPMAKDG